MKNQMVLSKVLHPSSRMKRLGKFFNVLNQHIVSCLSTSHHLPRKTIINHIFYRHTHTHKQATFTIDSQLLYYVKLTGAFRKAILKGEKTDERR